MSKTLFVLDEAGVSKIVNSGGLNGRATPLVLLQSAWSGEGPYSLTLAVAGVTSDTSACHAVISPAPGSLAEYGECGVYVAAQTEGALLFYAESMPENDLIVNVLIVTPNGYISVVPNPEYGYLRYDEPQALTDEQKSNVITALGLNTEQPETGVQMELLWENASPSSNFAAQTINVAGLSECDAVFYVYRHGESAASIIGTVLITKEHDGQATSTSLANYDAAVYVSFRKITVNFSNNNVVFEGGLQNGTDRANRLIPLAFYGIRGVS